jgi:alpha-L-rhamnosidase
MTIKNSYNSNMKTAAPTAVLGRLFLEIIILNILVIVVSISLIISGCTTAGNSSLKFSKMLVEYAVNPVNIDNAHPRFSWIVTQEVSDQKSEIKDQKSEIRNQKQRAYRIIVSSTLKNLNADKADLWDSGRIESDETIQHEYLPDNLMSDCRYYWKVIVWDGEGMEHMSPPAQFETALLPGYIWKAGWIGNMPSDGNIPLKGFYMDRNELKGSTDTVAHDGCSLLLRYEKVIPKKVLSAKAFITGVGYYEFFINGERVGDHRLDPAKTPYHKYVLYDTYDITSFLKEGANAFGIHLGNGWYNPYKKWWNQYRMQWFGSKKATAEIRINFNDGTSETLITDEKWLWSHGPVIYNCVYDGEVYDARLEQKGWTETGFDDSAWKKVTVFSSYRTRMASYRMPPIKTMELFKPEKIKSGEGGMQVFDMRQNFTGWIRLEAKGKMNNVIKIRFAEDINADSTIDVTSNENANASVEYIMKSDQWEVYEPAFTFFGFRYVEISSPDGPPDIRNIEGKAIYSDNPVSGQFVCSNMLVNKIHRATVWSQKSNMLGYPMDCPQRDERLGWLGDAQVTAEEAMMNFNMALFYENWLEGIKENQDPKTGDIPIISPRPYIPDEGIEWSSTYIIMLWQYYTFYGDKRILSHHYSAMKRYMNFLDSLSKDFILPKGWIGDWGSIAEGWKEGEPSSVPTAFYYQNARVMSEVAEVLEMKEESYYYQKLASSIRDKFNLTFLDTLSLNYNDGSQMANSFPLYLGIVPGKFKPAVIENLVNDITVRHKNHLTTGVLGTKYMPEALAREGRADIAWRIINQKTPPGWNDMMKRYTTMCEFWTLKQSKNHVMMGSIDAWFYKYLAGIQPDPAHPAFSSFFVKPFIPDSMNYAKATVETIRGTISSQWNREKDNLSLSVEVPFNTTAEVFVPGDSDEEVKESGKPLRKSEGVEYIGYIGGYHKIKVGSGNYFFKIDINHPTDTLQRGN